jgi:hypothetical protein
MYQTPSSATGGGEMHLWHCRNLFLVLEIRIIFYRRPARRGVGGGVDVVNPERGDRVDGGWGFGRVEPRYSVLPDSGDIVCWGGVEACHFEKFGGLLLEVVRA